MTLDPNQIATEVEQEKNRHLIIKTLYLSRCKIWIMVLLTLLTPIAAYIYTRRWKAMFFSFLTIFFFLLIYVGDEEDFERAFNKGAELAPIVALATGIDNWLGICRARQKVILWNRNPSGDS
ncbi:MAG: hypothetical protein IGQ88_12950 [Gloeomargaritaceae cyanobacterium C42_A2020_066]|nr:hypothetical protein [Gloeomargaritaceae cyanobacterium C42_A2020_066]